MKHKISVILPVYNTEKYLKQCLDSILAQTLHSIEVIIINDASPDNSLSIIHEYMAKDNRIHLIDKKSNEGVAKARNDGIICASGEFVSFIDSDDLYPEKHVLEQLYDCAIQNNVRVAGGRSESIINGKVVINSNPIQDNGLSFKQESHMKYADFQYDYGYWCYIYNREMLLDNDIFFPPYIRFQDPPFFVKALYSAGEYAFFDKPVYRYRIIDNDTKYTLKKAIDMLSGIMDNLSFSREHELAKLHYLSARRLNNDAAYMSIKSLYSDDEGTNDLFLKLIQANNLVDAVWLKKSGYDIEERYVNETLRYTYQLAKKYEKFRNHKMIKLLKRLKP